jgi:hypothetical protein
MRRLTKLRIDEVSCVVSAANRDARVLIRKSDDDAPRARLFNEIVKSDPPIIKTKKEEPMTQVNIFKLKNVDSVHEVCKSIVAEQAELSEFDFTEMVKGHADQTGQKFEKVFADPDIQTAYAKVRDASYVKALGYPVAARTAPMEAGVDTDGAPDNAATAARAYAQLQNLISEQRRLSPMLPLSKIYEQVFAENPELVSGSVWHSAATGEFTGTRAPSSRAVDSSAETGAFIGRR